MAVGVYSTRKSWLLKILLQTADSAKWQQWIIRMVLRAETVFVDRSGRRGMRDERRLGTDN